MQSGALVAPEECVSHGEMPNRVQSECLPFYRDLTHIKGMQRQYAASRSLFRADLQRLPFVMAACFDWLEIDFIGHLLAFAYPIA